MAYTTIHRKPNGAKYLYSVEGHWDSVKKQSRNKQVCLGRIDDQTGELIPSERKTRTAKRAASAPDVTARSYVIGPCLILKKMADDIGLSTILKSCFPRTSYTYYESRFFPCSKGDPAVEMCALECISHASLWRCVHKSTCFGSSKNDK
jgi:hypothetical protein